MAIQPIVTPLHKLPAADAALLSSLWDVLPMKTYYNDATPSEIFKEEVEWKGVWYSRTYDLTSTTPRATDPIVTRTGFAPA